MGTTRSCESVCRSFEVKSESGIVSKEAKDAFELWFERTRYTASHRGKPMPRSLHIFGRGFL